MGELHAELGVGSAMMWILISTPGPTGAEGAGGTEGNWLRCPWAVAETNRQHTNDKHRPIGGRRGACGAWPGFETTRRAKLAARTASGRAGHAAAGDLAGHSNAGDPAGRRPRADKAARPHSRALRRPEHQRHHKHKQHNAPPRMRKTPARRCGTGFSLPSRV